MQTNINTASNLAIGMSSEMTQTIVVKGHVNIKVIEGDKEWTHFDGPNCLVNLGRTNLAYLLAEGSSSRIITTMKLGDGPDPTSPQPPAATDEDLDNVLQTISLNGFLYQPAAPTVPSETSVKFSFYLNKDEGNGTGSRSYTEAGLYTYGDVLFARETFERLVKNSSRKIIFAWSIMF